MAQNSTSIKQITVVQVISTITCEIGVYNCKTTQYDLILSSSERPTYSQTTSTTRETHQ